MGQTASVKQRLGAVFVGVLALGAASAAMAGTTTYAYDALGRVVTVNQANGVITTYTYDPAGNRSGQNVNMTLPIARPSTASVNENSVNNTLSPTIIGAIATGVVVTTIPSHGTATPSGASFLYTPTTCYAGADSFMFTANNGGQASQPAPFSITVNLIPLTVSDISQVVATNSTNNWINVTNVDLSSHITCAQTVSGLVITQAPGHGTATASMTAAGPQIQYTPATNFTGSDVIKYAAVNGTAGNSPSPGTITLTVNSSRSIWGQFPWGSGTW